MTRHTPILAREKSAAALLDLKPCEFRRLVDAGALPGPIKLHGIELWRYADLEAVASGAAMEDDFET